MSKPNLCAQWKIAINKNLSLNKELINYIKESYFEIKATTNNSDYHFEKLGDFRYNSYILNDNVIDLDLALIKYITYNSFDMKKAHDEVLDFFKKLPHKFSIKRNDNYIVISTQFKNIKIYFRIILMIRNHDSKNYIDYANRNGNIEKDYCSKLTNDFIKANNISNGVLFKFKKLLNFILGGQFKYTYNIDYAIITWFYEYLCRTINTYLESKTAREGSSFNIDQFMNRKNLKKWFAKEIKINNLFYFILIKFQDTNTYYFNSLEFEDYEIFQGVSRYSLNTKTSFRQPITYFDGFRIFDLENYDDLNDISSKYSNSDGYSKVSWDKAKSDGKRYFVSPKIISGFSNYAMFKKWFTKLGASLYTKLSDDLKKDIRTKYQREAMEDLNIIAHNWLTSYQNKISYLIPYFDKKYPFNSQANFDITIKAILTILEKINPEDWIIENDN